MGDEELTAVGIRAGIGHGQDSRPVVPQILDEFVLEPVTRSPGARTIGAAALDHEILDDPMKFQIVVKTRASRD